MRLLAATIEPTFGKSPNFLTEDHQGIPVISHSIVLVVATELRIELAPYFTQTRRELAVKPVLYRAQLRSKLLLRSFASSI